MCGNNRGCAFFGAWLHLGPRTFLFARKYAMKAEWGKLMENLKLSPGVPYRKMYYTLFTAVTDALRFMESGNSAGAIALLKQAQRSTEDQYINAAEENPRLN